jgi:CubicO group peptidase (beta-lactamase class C family)
MNPSTTRLADTNFRKISRKIVSEMKRLDIPGVAIGISHGGREWAAGFGTTSIENPLPVTPDTLFQVGSISKTFTGTLLMMLAEQGKVYLDTPVCNYLPDFRLSDESVARKVTIRHLLTHTGGWVGDYFNDFGPGPEALEKMVKDIARLPQIQPLGKIWSYNNTGFNIAARVIEVATNKTYEQALQDMLLDPLDLRMTYLYPSDILFTHRFVVGHSTEKKKIKVARPWAIGRAGNGVGGVVSTVKDLLKYARFHMSDGRSRSGKRLIRRQSLEAMRQPQVSQGPRGDMGITWFIRYAGDLTAYAHGGATHGQQAYFFYIPEKEFALAILTNSDDGGIITSQTFGWTLDLYFGIKTETPKPLAKAQELEEFVGRYMIGTECFDIKVKGKYLMYHPIPLGGFPTPDTPPGPARPPMRFAFFDRDKLIGLDEPYNGALADILRDDEGHVEYFRVGSRAHKKIT